MPNNKYYKRIEDDDYLEVDKERGLSLRFRYEKPKKYVIDLIVRDKKAFNFNKFIPKSCTIGEHANPSGYTPKCNPGGPAISLRKPDHYVLMKWEERYFYPLTILHEIGHSNVHFGRVIPKTKTIERVKYEVEAWLFALGYDKELGLLGYGEEELYRHIRKQLATYAGDKVALPQIKCMEDLRKILDLG